MERAGVPRAPIVHDFSVAGNTATSSAFVTAAAAVVGASDEVLLHDTSAKDVYLAWANTTAASNATTGANCIAVPASYDGIVPLSIPSGSSLFIKGVSDTAGSGLLVINRLVEPINV